MIRRLIAALVFTLALVSAGASEAATLYISEFANGVSQVGSTSPQMLPQAALSDQTVAIGGTSVQSAAFGSKTHAILLTSDTPASIVIGSSPTATTANFLLPAGTPMPFVVVPGQKIAVIANTTGGSGTPVVVSGTVGIDQTTPGTTNGVVATGNVASGATDSGNPIKTGCAFNSTNPTVTTGQRVDCQADSRGNIKTLATLSSITGVDGALNTSGGVYGTTSGAVGLYSSVWPLVFNGTGWDRFRGDTASPGIAQVEIAPTATNASALTPVVTATAAASKIIKASAGNLYGFNVTTGASAGTVYVFNATSLPGDGTVTPVKCYEVAANATLSVQYAPTPLAFSTGITIGFGTGTNCFTLANSATAFISGDGK